MLLIILYDFTLINYTRVFNKCVLKELVSCVCVF